MDGFAVKWRRIALLALWALLSPIIAGCDTLAALSGDGEPESAIVDNRTGEAIWLASMARSDLGGRPFLQIGPDVRTTACAVSPGGIAVYTTQPEPIGSVEPAATVDLGQDDFCTGSWVWNGSELVDEADAE